MNHKDDVTTLTRLGSNQTEYKASEPNTAILETFPNRCPERDYHITHRTNEFTSRCPKTDQPDFATITLEYIADRACLESKSLKLYFGAYRNEGAFMETIVTSMLGHFVEVCAPRWMRVTGTFNARGGIATTIVAEHKKS